jgi:hypothetical protein
LAHIDVSKDPVQVQESSSSNESTIRHICADFETFNVKIDTCQPNANRELHSEDHEASSKFVLLLCSIISDWCLWRCPAASGEKFEPVIYTAQSDDDDIGAMFNKALIEYAHMLYNKYDKYPKAMIITESEQAAFERSTHCDICEKELIRREDCVNDEEYESKKKNGMNPVRDHYHLTGLYRGAAHAHCNLQRQSPNFYPVVIHNLSGFDAHLFIMEFKGKIKCILSTDEKYISFTREVV